MIMTDKRILKKNKLDENTINIRKKTLRAAAAHNSKMSKKAVDVAIWHTPKEEKFSTAWGRNYELIGYTRFKSVRYDRRFYND